MGLISASRSDLTMDVNKRRWVELYSHIWPRFGSLDVDVRFSEHGRTLTERCYLLLDGRDFDNGNLKGFLRQHGAIHDQRLVLYKPYDESSAYLLGTRKGVVPRRRDKLSASGSLKSPACPISSGSLGSRAAGLMWRRCVSPSGRRFSAVREANTEVLLKEQWNETSILQRFAFGI